MSMNEAENENITVAGITVPRVLRPKAWETSDGQVRVYLNGWKDVCGVEMDYYKTGNLRWATYKGESVSNGWGTRNLMYTKVWIDQGGRIHVDGTYDRECAEDIEKTVAEAIGHHGGKEAGE